MEAGGMPFSARRGDVSYRSLLLIDLSVGKFCLFDKGYTGFRGLTTSVDFFEVTGGMDQGIVAGTVSQVDVKYINHS
jgi:hypothetical protein